MKKINLPKASCSRYLLSLIFGMIGIASLWSQETLSVSGTVTSADDGMPIPGVSIIVKGSSQGTTTDFDGNFQIETATDATLAFSYVGFDTQEAPVNGQSTLNVALKTNTAELDEVVVVGYGTQRKALVTGANLQVDGDALQNQSRTNPLEALQGKTPGVQITSTSGQPGAGLNVVIRGLGSTGGNAPLYVVDGVLTGDISYLNNADIESISVLKDAASAAIYGSQASNGVVLVTTKSGKRNSSQITFDQYYGFQSVPSKIDLLDGREYVVIINEAAVNSGRTPFFNNEEIDNLPTETDWMDKMFVDNVVTQNYSLGFTGGGENSTFSSSLAYTQQGGIVGGEDLSNYERYNVRINSEHDMYDGFVTFGENLSFAYEKSNGVRVGNQYNNSLRPAFGTTPLMPFRDENGDFFNTANTSTPYISGQSNPYAEMVYNNMNENDNQKLLGNVYAELNFTDNLKFRTSLGIDYNASNSHSYEPIYQLSIFSFRNRDRVYQSQSKGYSLIWDNLLTYNFNIAKDHEFEALLGTSSYSYQGTYLNATNVDLTFDELKYGWLDNAVNSEGGGLLSAGGGPNFVNKRMSYFGRLNYNYKDKYLLNTTFRADGSSNFDQSNRWGYFPSISGGWVLSKEDFLSDSDIFNFLKLRASWGQVGNQNAGAFQYLAPITYSNTNYTYGNEEGVLAPGAFPSRLANPGLKWETSEQTNIGLDARVLNNTLNVALDFYEKVNKDFIIVAPVPSTSGADAPFSNGGDVTNRGVELALTYANNIGDFQYNVGVNGAYNDNKVGNIPTPDGILHGEINQLFDNSPEFYRAESGFPLGYFWGLQTSGLFQNQAEVDAYNLNGTLVQPNASPGDVRFVDQNNDGTINADDKINIGDPNPDLTFGFNIGFNYKALDFILSGNGVAGNQIVQSYRNQSNQFANYTTDILNRWTGENSSNSIPRVTLDNRNLSNFSDLYIKNGDFLRLNNLTIGYDLAKATDDFVIQKLRIYASALNLYTFTNYDGMDPEIGYGISTDTYSFSSGVDLGYYPRPRTFLLGLNVIF
ncbi:SusC/RagA family TonB-linked outer membrane protein [Flavimarina sp. Hel_I_48]|uniref:SusC/RagA family TonB-linked outer membrane protein n=1 Tax=Flavimarina sp. Hel_I_48 TaxID=1392488 RepID=UPI0004DF7DAB|nr:TonB-dependent receptor [Flavimarina sp. Hel_I_48]